MEEDLEQKLSESNVAQIEETKIKVKERIRTIEGRTKSIENEQETINKGVFSYKEQSARQEISQNKEDLEQKLSESNVAQIEETKIKRGSMYLGLEYPDPYTHNSTQREDDLDVSPDTKYDIIITSDSRVRRKMEKYENRAIVTPDQDVQWLLNRGRHMERLEPPRRWWRYVIFLLLLPLTVFVSILLTGNNIALMRGRGKRHLNGLQPTSNMEAIPQRPISMLIASSMKFVDIPPSHSTCGSLIDRTNTFTTSRLELEESGGTLASYWSDAKLHYRQFPRGSASNCTDELTTYIAKLEKCLGTLASYRSDAKLHYRQLPRGSASNGTDELTTDITELGEYWGTLASYRSIAKLHYRQFPRGSASNGTDELTTDIAELEESGINSSSSTSTSHFDNLFVANEEQLKPDLKVALTVTLKGAHMHIPDTGVELDIPTGAVKRKRLIEMTIIPFDKQYASTADFSSNSSVVVELLPNKAIFSLPVHLQLPHCLQLKRNYKEIKNPVTVFVSHHKTGPPVWEEDSIASANCTLEEDHCVIHLKQFCWVKYEIDDKIVVAKRLKVFTAGKSLHPSDNKAEIEVGYYMDLPGRAEDMTASLGMEFYQTKPFIFVIDGELPLQLLLSKIVPKEWTYITPEENPKNIPYKSVVGDKDTSCPFALETLSSSERKPLCILKIVQGNESVELSMRF